MRRFVVPLALMMVLPFTIVADADPYQVIDKGTFLNRIYGTSLSEINGQAAALYNIGGQCRYAVSDGTTWTPTVVPGAGYGMSLIEFEGEPTFVATSSGNLKLWTRSGGVWNSSDIPSTSSMNAGSIADIGGEMHLTYESGGGGKVYHSALGGGGWTPTLVFNGRDWVNGGDPALAEIGSQPALTFYGSVGTPVYPTHLYYSEYDGSAWQTVELGTGSEDWLRELVLTSYRGGPVVIDGNGGNIRMNIRRDGVWETDIIDSGSGMGLSAVEWGHMLAVSHVGYASGQRVVRLGLFDGTDWDWRTVDNVTQLDHNRTSLAVIASKLGLAYEDHANYGELRYMEFFIPEPSTLALAGLGVLGLLCIRCRKR